MPLYIGADLISQLRIATVNNTSTALSLQEKSIAPSENDQIILPDSGYNGLSKITITSAPLQSKIIDPSTLTQTIIADNSYYGLSNITINAISTEEKEIVSNGTYSPTNGKYFSNITVNVPEKTFLTQEKTVTPIATEQTIVPGANYAGLSKVVITAAPLQAKTVNPTTEKQTINADTGYYGLSSVIISPISIETKKITANGSYAPTAGKYFSTISVNVSPKLTSISVTPSLQSQTINPSAEYDGFNSILIKAINLQQKNAVVSQETQIISADDAYNGLSSVTISGAVLQAKMVDPSAATQEVAADDGNYGLSTVTINAIKTEEGSASANGTYTPTDGSYFSSFTVNTSVELQEKTAAPSESEQIIKPDANYSGLSKVTIGAAPLQSKTIAPTTNAQNITADGSYYGLASVTVNAIAAEERTITENGTFSPSSGSYFSSVTVNVIPKMQSLTITPSEETQSFSPAEGQDGYNDISVGAIQVEAGAADKNGTYTPTDGSYFNTFTVNLTYNKCYVGSGAPSQDTGEDGDFYFDTSGG